MEHSSHPKTPEVPVLRKRSVKIYLEELRLVAEIMTGLHHRSACQASWKHSLESQRCKYSQREAPRHIPVGSHFSYAGYFCCFFI